MTPYLCVAHTLEAQGNRVGNQLCEMVDATYMVASQQEPRILTDQLKMVFIRKKIQRNGRPLKSLSYRLHLSSKTSSSINNISNEKSKKYQRCKCYSQYPKIYSKCYFDYGIKIYIIHDCSPHSYFIEICSNFSGEIENLSLCNMANVCYLFSDYKVSS